MPSVHTLRSFTVISRKILETTSGANDWVARPALLVTRAGIWVRIYTAAPQHVATGASTVIHIRFSANQGLTWTAEDTTLSGAAVIGFPLVRHGSNLIADAWLMLAPNGDLLIHAAEGLTVDADRTYQYRSTNGGASWTDEGDAFGSPVWADHCGGGIVIGSDHYITGRVAVGGTPAGADNLYKSADNGVTWNYVSTITHISVDQRTGEVGLMWTGGTNLLTILRGTDSNADHTYLRRSHDLGLTWDALHDFTNIMGGLKLHQPRLRRVGSRIYGMGRDWIGDAGTFADNNVFFWSDDEGLTWSPVYILNSAVQVDSGYVDMLRRGDRTFYALAYEGTYDNAHIMEYIVDIPSHTAALDGWQGGFIPYIPPPEPEPAENLLDFSDAKNSMYVGVL